MNEFARRHASGLAAERLAEALLRLKFYRILARRFRVSAGEIDLIAQRGRRVVFVEVKARAGLGDAAEALSARQRARIARAAAAFLQSRPGLEACEARFDVVLVSRTRRFGLNLPRIIHLKDAWSAP